LFAVRGWLDKQGRGALRVWQRRYFVLRSSGAVDESSSGGNSSSSSSIGGTMSGTLAWYVGIKATAAQNEVRISDLVVHVTGIVDDDGGGDIMAVNAAHAGASAAGNAAAASASGAFSAEHFYFTMTPRDAALKQWRIRANGVFNGRAWVAALAAHGALLRFPAACVHAVAIDWRELLLARAALSGARHYFVCLRGVAAQAAGSGDDVPVAVEKRVDLLAGSTLGNGSGSARSELSLSSSSSGLAVDDGIIAAVALVPRRVVPLVLTVSDELPIDALRVVVIDSSNGAVLPSRDVPGTKRRAEAHPESGIVAVTVFVEILAERAQSAIYVTAQCGDRVSAVCPVVVADLLSPSFQMPEADAVVTFQPAADAPQSASHAEQKSQAPARPLSPSAGAHAPPEQTFRLVSYSFAATKSSQLSLSKGELVEVIEQGGAWWKGRVQGTDRVGRFPMTYTEAIRTDDALAMASRSRAAPPPGSFRAVALFDWLSDNAADLQFRKGDALLVTGLIDDNWWHGSLAGDGRSGKFPRNRVERVADAAAPMPSSPSPVSPGEQRRRAPASSDGAALRDLAVDDAFLVAAAGGRASFRCAKEPTIAANEATVTVDGATELTCVIGARVPIAITTDFGRVDCSVKVLRGKAKLERGKEWRIESQDFRKTPAGDVTTLFVTFRAPLRPGDTLSLIATLDGRSRSITVRVVDSLAPPPATKQPSPALAKSSSSSSSKPSAASGGGDVQQQAALQLGERLRVRRRDERAGVESLVALTHGELMAVMAATHAHGNPSAAELDALSDELTDRLAVCEVRAGAGGPSGARSAAEASLLKMALRSHEDLADKRDSSLLPLLDAAVAFGVN
jgi:hypothetical protein